jgi:hypothetical protein
MNVVTTVMTVKGDSEMPTFTIDPQNNITVFASVKEAKSNREAERFSSNQELARLAGKWPASRLTKLWNGLPGVTPLKKFQDRKAAVSRIWQAIQGLAPAGGAHLPRVAPKTAGSRKRTTQRKDAAMARDGSKKAAVLNLLQRPGGASLNKLMAVTGWQAHSVRGFISGALGKKMGLTVESTKSSEEERTYSIQG